MILRRMDPNQPPVGPGHVPLMPRILAVTGGVGGAKLASGLASVLDPSILHLR